MAIAHIGESWQHHVSGKDDFFIREKDHHIAAGMGASEVMQSYLAVTSFYALEQSHFFF